MSGEDSRRGENCRQLAVSSLTLSLVPHLPFCSWDSQQVWPSATTLPQHLHSCFLSLQPFRSRMCIVICTLAWLWGS